MICVVVLDLFCWLSLLCLGYPLCLCGWVVRLFCDVILICCCRWFVLVCVGSGLLLRVVWYIGCGWCVWWFCLVSLACLWIMVGVRLLC